MTSPARQAQAIFQLPSSAFVDPAIVNPGSPPAIRSPQSELVEDSDLPIARSPDLMMALQEVQEALPAYIQAQKYYDGDPENLFASPKIQQLLAMNGVYDVDMFNYARVPVDAVAEKLRIRAVTVVAGGEEDETEQPQIRTISPTGKTKPDDAQNRRRDESDRAQRVLDRLRRTNKMQVQEGDLFKKMCEYGDAYLMVWPVVEEPGPDAADDNGVTVDMEAPDGRVVSVDIYVNSPLGTRVFYDEENPLQKRMVIKTWEWTDPDGRAEDGPVHRATLTYPDRIERWVSRPGEDETKAESWKPYVVEDLPWPQPNPTGRIPYFHFRTNWTYGTPVHRPAFGPQQLVNKLISAHAVTIDYQSFPQRYALSNPKADEVLGNLIDPDFPEDDDDDPEGDGRSQLRADPSAVWRMPGVTSVGQFQAADPQVFLAPYDRYVRAIAELTGTPLHRFTGYTQPPSGAALRVSDEPLNDKVSTFQRDGGNELSDAYEFALELMDLSEVEVTIKWEPARAAVGVEDWNIVEKKIANGVPVRNALVEAGYSEDEVQEWLADETGADLVRRVALLNSLGTAVQTLGAGVALGIVSAPQVGDIIARFLGLTAEQIPALEEAVELQPVDEEKKMALEQQKRSQQMTEHAAGAPPGPSFDPTGRPIPPPPDRPLPPPPGPPAPVRVGD